MARTPRNAVKARSSARLPKVGDKLLVELEVKRLGRNSFDTADTITVYVPGHSTPVTVNASALIPDLDD